MTRPHEAGKNGRGKRSIGQTVTLTEVNRILEVGQLLASVLTSEEWAEIQTLLDNNVSAEQATNTWLRRDCPKYR